jgi:thioredoxin 1
MSKNNVVHVTHDTFEAEILNSAEPVVIDFWAPWCGPCRAIAPVLEELAGTYDGKVKVAKINVDEEPHLAQAFQVRGIPTLYGLFKGEVKAQMVGFGGKKRIVDMFSALSDEASAAA